MSNNALFTLPKPALPTHDIGHCPNNFGLIHNNNVKITDAGRLHALLRRPTRGGK